MLMLRSAVLSGYVEVAESVGLNPYPLMRVSGVDPAAFSSPEGWIEARCVGDLLELSAEQAGIEDFGIRMSGNRGVSHLGPVGLVAREEPDVRSAFGIVWRHMKLHNEAICLSMTESQGLATVRVQAAEGIIFGRNSMELVVASIVRILSDFLPDGWRPVSTSFTHDPPASRDRHVQVLGPSIFYNNEIDGLVVASSDLAAKNRLSNPLLRPYTQEYLELLAPPPNSSTSGQVRHLIATLLPTEDCSAVRIARSLGIDRRTLQRRLAQSGETYSSILHAVRAEQAQSAIERGDRMFTEISAELGFSQLSVFSRWFREEFGASPKAWSESRSGSPTAPRH